MPPLAPRWPGGGGAGRELVVALVVAELVVDDVDTDGVDVAAEAMAVPPPTRALVTAKLMMRRLILGIAHLLSLVAATIAGLHRIAVGTV